MNHRVFDGISKFGGVTRPAVRLHCLLHLLGQKQGTLVQAAREGVNEPPSQWEKILAAVTQGRDVDPDGLTTLPEQGA
jgi:hypothetical protein